MKKILIFSLFLYTIPFFAQNNIVKIENGAVEGAVTEGGIRTFKGIPFAQPPVGNLRWKAPQPAQNWEGVKKCTAFSASPMQDSPRPFMFWSSEFLIPQEPISEDCLYLNVWTGAKKEKEKRPVLVYIYGGGFRSGGTACSIYDGAAMAKKGVVFVSINYRVGVFGFLVHPELSAEADYKASGNYALLDMIAALKWVQKNIAAFGGDPKNVTIAGQSAGAFGVNYLCASPLAKGLFQRAIAQSGGSFYNNPLRPNVDMKGAEEQGVKYAKTLNCNTLAELRSKSAEEIQKVQGGFSAPIIDGYVMPESIFNIYKKGKQNDVTLIVGRCF
jgi:para-nitrobenzyl esterase